MFRPIRLYGTTNGSGALTVGGIGSSVPSVNGSLYAAQLIDGTFDDGVDITITAELPDLSVALLTKANFNADTMVYPRVLQQLATDGTDLSTHALPICVGTPKMVIAQGGDTKVGGVILWVLDD